MAGHVVLVIDDSATITKVVQLVLAKAGYDVRVAADGEAGLAAAREQRPDLILLDFVMPRMNGYQFCRETAADPALRDVPVVLMSAKGDQVGERFVKVMGIVDYITKPFSPDAITAVVQHSIAKYGRVLDDPTARRDAAAPARKKAHTEQQHRARRDAISELRSGLVDAVRLSLEQEATLLPDGVERGALLLAEIERALTVDTVAAALARIDVRALGPATPAGLNGELQVVPLAEVLQLLDVQEQSGTLNVTRVIDGVVNGVAVYLRRGRIEQAISTGLPEEFRFGRYLIDAEFISQDDFEICLANRARDNSAAAAGLMGADLIRHGQVSDRDVKTALARQSSELIYEVLRWRAGEFRFVASATAPDHVIDAGLQLDIEAVLMEGYRRVDEWHLIERVIDDFDLVFLRNEDAVTQMGRGRLTREELAVLEMVNGKNSVKDIVRKSRLGSFEVSKMLYRLLSIKLVRRRVMPIAV